MTGSRSVKILFTIFCLFLLQGAGAAFGAVSLTAVVSPNTAVIGDTVTYTVTISGELSEVTHPLIKLPDSLRQLQKDPSISQRVSIVNGKYSRNVDFSYELSCVKAGKFVITPASLRADNTSYDSNVVTISILSGGRSAKGGTALKSGQPRLVAQIHPDDAYVGQAISIVISMYVPRALIYNGQWGWMEKPSGSGFLPEAVNGPSSEWKLTTVSGVATMVCILGRYVVTPTQPGQYKFKPGIAMVLLKDNSRRSSRRRSLMDSFFDDDFFGRSRSKKVNVAGLPVSFSVRPLPSGDSGNKDMLCISNMRASAKVSRTSLNENESLTYTLTFEGNGDLRSLGAPVLSIADNFRVFESKSDSNIVFGAEGIKSAKVFEYVIVPTRSGNLQLPEVKVECFDPATGKVVEVIAPCVDLQVIAGEKEEDIQMVTVHSSKQAVKLMGRDIHYIAESRKDTVSLNETRVHSKKLFWVLLLIPLIIAVVDYYYSNRRALSFGERKAMRASSALKSARTSLLALKNDKDDSRKYYSAMRALMIRYIADKLGLAPSGTIFSEVKEIILKQSVSEEQLQKFDEYLELFSSAAFSPVKPSTDAMANEANELSVLLSEIDRRWS